MLLWLTQLRSHMSHLWSPAVDLLIVLRWALLSWRCCTCLYSNSALRLCHDFLTFYFQFTWHHSITRPQKPVKGKYHGESSHTTRFIAYSVSNFVAMATWVIWDKFNWRRWIGRPRKQYHRTKNYDSILRTTGVIISTYFFDFFE